MTAAARVSLVVAAVAIALLAVVGTGGFGLVTADRNVEADVVEDEEALFGIRVVETAGVVGGPAFRLAEPIDNSGGRISLDSAAVDGPLAVVAADDDGVDVACTAAGGGTVTLTTKASGADVRITTYTDVGVVCTAPTPTPIPTSTPPATAGA